MANAIWLKTRENLENPNTLLGCDLSHEYALSDGNDVGVNIQRTLNHKNQGLYLLGLVNLLHLVWNMTQEASLESVLSAAFSRKHVTDTKKSFISQEEAMEKAKGLRLSPESAMKCIQQTPSWRHLVCEKQVCQAI